MGVVRNWSPQQHVYIHNRLVLGEEEEEEKEGDDDEEDIVEEVEETGGEDHGKVEDNRE